jgi:hypothetical protein
MKGWLMFPKDAAFATPEEKREFREVAKTVALPDVAAYDRAAADCRGIFIERRAQYGSHMEKPRQYAIDSLYIKAVRLCKDHESGREMKPDTLRDFVNFALMVLTQKED